MTLIGIDPGKSGGIAVSYENMSQSLYKMPEVEGDLMAFLKQHVNSAGPGIVYLEKVGGYIGSPQAGSRMFVFGENYGFIKGVCMTLGFKLNLVTPQKWQKAFGLGTRSGSTTKEWKNKLRAEAQRLYPNLDVPLQVADALLILEYGRRCENGTIN